MVYTPTLFPDLPSGMTLNFTYSLEPKKSSRTVVQVCFEINMQIASPSHVHLPTVFRHMLISMLGLLGGCPQEGAEDTQVAPESRF